MADLEAVLKWRAQDLPVGATVAGEGRRLGEQLEIGRSKFMIAQEVSSEAEYKRRMVGRGKVMFHAQYGLGTVEDSVAGLEYIYSELSARGGKLDRFGICLRLSMGIPSDFRSESAAETGLRLVDSGDWERIAQAVPIQPHFGDHMVGSPASTENAMHALQAGITTIGNFSQYFTYDYPGWTDEAGRVISTVKALGIMAAAKRRGAIVHSNLDDGPGGLFADRTTTAGWALLEKYIVEDLIGAELVHCFGNMVTRPAMRIAMLLAMDEVHGRETAGSMIFGDTMYGPDEDRNIGILSGSVLTDILGQILRPTGHAVHAIPLTEYKRIPSPPEIVQAQTISNQLVDEARGFTDLVDLTAAYELKSKLLAGGAGFRDRVLNSLTAAGVDIADPLHLMLALRTIGPRRIEELYGEGEPDADLPFGRRPALPTEMYEYLAKATTVAHSKVREAGLIGRLSGVKVTVASSDLHEFGKLVVAASLRVAGAQVLDLGTNVEPPALAEAALRGRSNAIALSTLNGVARSYIEELLDQCRRRGLNVPIFVGGKLNQDSGGALPEDVSSALAKASVTATNDYLVMIRGLGSMAES